MTILENRQKTIILFFVITLLSYGTNAQKLYPLTNSPLLAGGFAELRSAHFHSGLDFKTGGVEGMPVLCVDDGDLFRISVSPTGYGNAIYIKHPDSTVSVYGHLSRFIPRIENLVREIQYHDSSFMVNKYFERGFMTFKKGDQIAWSGNSGSSGGPHLHFEIRDAKTEYALNVNKYYDIPDKTSPIIKGIYIYNIDDMGVEASTNFSVQKASDGQYTTSAINVRSGLLGLGVYVDDKMEGSNNKLGVYKIESYVDDKLLCTMAFDSVDLNDGLAVNAVSDYGAYAKGRCVYRCFGKNISFHTTFLDEDYGCFGICEDSIRKVDVKVYDYNGNRSTLSCVLKGVYNRGSSGNVVLDSDNDNNLEFMGLKISVPKNALARNIEYVPEMHTDTISDKNYWIICAKQEALLKSCTLSVDGECDEKDLLCLHSGRNSLLPLRSKVEQGRITATSNILGTFSLQRDTVAPKITYKGIVSGKMIFIVSDNLSGVSLFDVYVNGKWTLAEYDAKKNRVSCNMSEPSFVKGSNVVTVKVKDRVNNINEITHQVVK